MSWWRTWRAPVVQLAALAAITITSAAYIDHENASAAADLAAEQGAGPRIAVPVRAVPHAAAPVSVEIPALRTRSRLVQLHKLSNGTLQVPSDPAQAGWYVGSSHPGDAGPTVLAGHVDSLTGPGVFYHLDHLRQGDVIAVRRADGTVARFVVRQVLHVPKRKFPTQLVYIGDGRPSLRLISCGGVFDRRTGHYLDNIVVTAAPA